MREAELRQHATCSLCQKKILSGGLPLFWRVRIERFGVDLAAAHRKIGLEMMLGDARLAMMMGPDEEMARPVMEPVTITVCEACACESEIPVAALAETAR